MTKEKYFERNGFDSNGYTNCVVGDNTYNIKDRLKEIGGKYNPVLKWHLPTQVPLDGDFKYVQIKFDDIMKWDEQEEKAIYLDDAEMQVTRTIEAALPPSKSEYMGQVGERIRNVTAILKSTKSYIGKFGLTNIYSFQSGENEMIWFSQKELNLADNTKVDLTGTVKAHKEYQNRKQTVLNRCVIKEI